MKTLTREEERLAREIASKLGDLHSLASHRKYVKIYSEKRLREAMVKALAVKEEDVLVSRGAIFTGILKSDH
jgi:hypothetical protein